MFKNNRNRIMSFLLAFLMILAPIANLSIFAKDADSYVNLRVEGNNYTILEKTRIKLGDLEKNLDLSDYGLDKEFEEPTAFHALVFGLENYTDLDLKSEDDFESMVSNFGVYIKNIDGLKAATDGKPNSGWGYMVNNEGPAVGMDGFKVNDGNDIVVYYQEDWQDIKQAYFNKEEVEVGQNKKFTLNLEGIGFDENFSPVKEAIEGAEILLNNKATGIKTDKNGNFTMSLPIRGEYKLSAVRKNNEGIINITRPFAKIKVVKSDQVYVDQDKISKWAFDEVMEATDVGFVNGDRHGNFMPQDEVSRSEFIKMVLEALEFEIEENLDHNFTDINKNQWFYKYVTTGSKLGIVEGHDNKFMPNKKISRQEMAVIISNALEKKGIDIVSNEEAKFKDRDKIAHWAIDSVDKIAKLDIMQGHNNNFMPLDRATRETATITLMRLYRSIDGIEENPAEIGKKDVRPIVNRTGEKIYTDVDNPTLGSIGGEWAVLSLARGSIDVPENYYENYYNNIANILEEKDGKLHHVKYTEYSRLILALTAIGEDVRDVNGYNLLEPLADFNTVIKQGINGPIFALIALDSNNYEIPTDVDFEVVTERDMLIDYILEREIEGGGWDLGAQSTTPYSDITAMALQALAPYYNKREDVRDAVDRGIKVLSNIQDEETGGYYSWGVETSESAAQVITALSALGIDAHGDSRFIKNGQSVLDNLLSYELESGGFQHTKSDSNYNLMATEQVMYSLVAYNRYVNNQNSLYDMTDIK